MNPSLNSLNSPHSRADGDLTVAGIQSGSPEHERKRMNQGKPVRVVSVDGEVVKVRPLTWSERFSYQLGYAVGWLAHGIHEIVRKLRIFS